MELATVKAEVKAWEKAFKATQGRVPTKDDIKNDKGGIAEKYALYRRLTKQSSQAAPSSSVSTSQHASSSAGPSRTPSTIPSNDYPTTPTPHSRRGSSSSRRQAAASEELILGPLLGKRPASSPKSPSRLFVTPKKPRPSYSGPVVDPNPINPFSATPPKPPPSLFPSLASSSVAGSSPFLHASSPRKLKELLESNSLKKVRERHDEITPRTKARMRLTGDFVTPMKDKEPRKRRGERADKTVTGGSARAMLEEDIEEEVEDEDEEDEFGPSPMRPGLTRTFTELLQSSVEEPKSTDRGKEKKKVKMRQEKVGSKQGDLRGFFGMAPGRRKVEPTKPPPEIVAIAATPPRNATSESAIQEERTEQAMDADKVDGGQVEEEEERLSTPPPDPETYASPVQTPSRSARNQKYVSFSDDEVDEWDPEGGNVRRKVFITGTKRSIVRRGSLSSMSGDEDAEDEGVGGDSEEEVGSGGNHTDAPTLSNGDGVTISLEHEIPEVQVGTNDPVEEGEYISTLSCVETTPPTSSCASTIPTPLPPLPLLSLLSLRSPPSRNTSRINDLRVKAIFNPSSAARLKAVQRGQDIVSGETNLQSDEDEEGLLESYENRGVGGDGDGGEGDDDWDEECDGWKGTGGTMDDEAW